jgi:magnesium transporter
MRDIDRISYLRHDTRHFFWVDLEKPDKEDYKVLEDEFEFHPLAIEDVKCLHERPKVEDYQGYFLCIFYSIHYHEDLKRIDMDEVNLFIGQNYVVSVHQEPIPEVRDAEQRWRHFNTVRHGIVPLVYFLLDAIVDNYFPVMDKLVEQAEEMEDIIFSEARLNKTVTMSLLELRKQFLQMRRVVGPERDVLNTLTNRDSPIFKDEALFFLRDVYDHIVRVMDTLDLYRDQLSGAVEANLTVASNDLNKTMRTLTAFSIILMVNSLMAGIYGMNFENMPELKWEFGYFGLLAFMVGITITLIIFFRSRKWL